MPSTEDGFSIDTRALLFPKWAFFRAPVVNEDNGAGENVSFCPRTEAQPGPSGEHTLYIKEKANLGHGIKCILILWRPSGLCR